MDWITVLSELLKFIAECRKNRSRDEVVDSVKNIGPFQKLAFRIHLRRSGYSKQDVSAAMVVLEDGIANGLIDTKEEIEQLVASAEETALSEGKSLYSGSAMGCVILALSLFFGSLSVADEIPSLTKTFDTPVEAGHSDDVKRLSDQVDLLITRLADAEKEIVQLKKLVNELIQQRDDDGGAESTPPAKSSSGTKVWQPKGLFGRKGRWINVPKSSFVERVQETLLV